MDLVIDAVSVDVSKANPTQLFGGPALEYPLRNLVMLIRCFKQVVKLYGKREKFRCSKSDCRDRLE